MSMQNRPLRRALACDALLLFALSAYELAARVDAMAGPLRLFFRMAVGEGVPLGRVLAYLAEEIAIFYTPLYLLGCALCALLAFFARRSQQGCALLCLPCAALTACGFLLRATLFGDLARALTLLPLSLLTLLCLLRALRRDSAAQTQDNGSSAQTQRSASAESSPQRRAS